MTYKLIIFDKDGTLLEFESVWISIGEELTARFKADFDVQETQQEILQALGMTEQHIDPSGILSSGTTSDIISVLNRFAATDTTDWTHRAMDALALKYEDDFTLIAGADETIKQLHDAGYTLAVVTADDYVGTTKFLEKFHILDYFDIVITSDRSDYQKPEKEILLPLLELSDIDYRDMVMIGDTPIDMSLGKNAQLGLTIGVLSGTSTAEDLTDADYIVQTINDIYQNGKLIWEDTNA